MPKPETCTAEVESNDVFRKANVLAARHCGTFGSGSDVDYYRFAAPVGTTTVTLTGDGSFAIGYVVKNRCLPVLTKQTAVSVKVGGASKDLCVRVSDPSHGLGSYILTKP